VQLTDVLANTPNAQYVQRVREVANVEAWMRYFAVYSLLLSRETSFATGRGDDFSMYRGVNDPRFLLLAHDWDTILNEGDTRPGTFTDSLFRMCPTVNPNANTTGPTVHPKLLMMFVCLVEYSFIADFRISWQEAGDSWQSLCLLSASYRLTFAFHASRSMLGFEIW